MLTEWAMFNKRGPPREGTAMRRDTGDWALGEAGDVTSGEWGEWATEFGGRKISDEFPKIR